MLLAFIKSVLVMRSDIAQLIPYGISDNLSTCSSLAFGFPPAFSIAAFKSDCVQSPSIAGCFAVILVMFQCVRSLIFLWFLL